VNNAVKNVLDGYVSDNLSNLVFESIDFLKDEPNEKILPVISKILSEEKSEGFILEMMKLLKWYKNLSEELDYQNSILSIRKIIKNKDASLQIKMQGITALGDLCEWPDSTLRKIIESESDKTLKNYAFRAILTQLKLPYQVIDLEYSLALNSEIEPSFDRINEITQARADGHFDHLS
jgi:hypothetical protein